MKSQSPSVPFQNHFFHEIRTLTANKHTTFVEIGLTQMWNEESKEASSASRQNLGDFVKLEENRTVVLSQSLGYLCGHYHK